MESENKKRILIVEDEPDILNLLADAFQYYGFSADLETEPELAFKKFLTRPKQYDAVLLDIKMGKKDGRDLYRQLKELDPDAKIFVFTGLEFDTNEFRKICPSFQDQYLVKIPVRMSSLVEKVQSVLN
jgi:DNA-binding response OmpR family regulator